MHPDHEPGSPRAYADESFREHPTAGIYVLAAVVLAPAVWGEVRDLMLQLRGRRRTSKLHWNEMDRGQQKTAAGLLAAVDGLHVVATGAPVPQRRQERARAACLAALVPELHDVGVRHLSIEARTPELDVRDVRAVSGARYGLPRGACFRIDHLRGCADPLLWSADVVAGAVRAHHDGDSVCRDILEARIYELRVSTGC